jgi:hypothetical protein
MLRRAAVLLVLAGLAAVPAGATTLAAGGKSKASAHLFVRIHVPMPGDVVLARVVVRGRPGIGVPVKLKLHALNADKLAPWITAVGGVVGLKRRPFKFVTVIAIVNKRPPRTAGTEARNPYQPYLDVELLDAQGAKPADAKLFFSAHKRVAGDILSRFAQPGQQELVDLFQPVSADYDTPIQRAIERGLPVVPLAGFAARSPSGLRTDPEPTQILTGVADTAKAACSNDADHTEKAEKKLEEHLNTTLVQVTTKPSATKKCDLTKFSFKGLKLSFSAPKTGGGTSTYAFSNITGSVCGDPLSTAWTVTFASTGEANRTASPKFSTANPATIGTRSFTGGSSLTAKLQYVTEDSPLMKVSGTPKGQVTKVVATPAQASVSSTAVETC